MPFLPAVLVFPTRAPGLVDRCQFIVPEGGGLPAQTRNSQSALRLPALRVDGVLYAEGEFYRAPHSS